MAKKVSKKPKIDYNKLRRAAYEYIVLQGKSNKDTAELLGVSEQAISGWSTESQPTWKEQRKARQVCVSTDTDNTRSIIRLLSERRLDIELQIMDAQRSGQKEIEFQLRCEARSLSDELSKQNKTLLTIDKDNRITLGVFIDVMDEIFNGLRAENESVYMATIDYQAKLIRRKTNELG